MRVPHSPCYGVLAPVLVSEQPPSHYHIYRPRLIHSSPLPPSQRYYSKLTNDFHVNKRVCGEVAIVPSKRMRNKIAGFITHLMKRIQKGPVRGISLKLQEEERERRMDFVPEKSALDTDITIDADTKDMLESFSAGMMSRIPHQVVGR